MRSSAVRRPLWRALWLLTGAALGTAACSRTPEAQPDAAAPFASAAPMGAAAKATGTSAAPPSTAAPAAAAAASYKLPGSARVVAIGDIHGDLTAMRGALKLAGAIDSDDRWIGKDLTVVQTGDQLDRGDQDREVLDVLEKLEASAKAAGGALHVLNGNHELMNAVFDFRYVTRKSFASFDEFSSRAGELAGRIPEAELGRAGAFMPGAPYAQKLARHPTVAMVGDSLFAHAGLLPAHVDYGLDRINREASAFLAGKSRELPRILSDEGGPVWTRLYGSAEIDDATCQTLGRVLAAVGAKRLVVGHTVQEHGISGACQERLFRIDIGLSAYYGKRPPQVLEITAAGARILGGTDAKKGKAGDSALHSAP
ncbi:MAG TPA: metallophosphoesterase [Polyangiaceae bacterium]|nr:metallophosphoesterase [Polyangiaceae bacterium]